MSDIKIQGVIFDLDGTLIDSEPLWQDAEIKVFGEEGLVMTRQDCTKTKGLPSVEAVKYWYPKMNNPTRSIEKLDEDLNNEVIRLIKEKGELKSGVMELLDFWKQKNLPMGIASSSYMNLIMAVVNKFDLQQYFNVIHSAEFEEYGKPHPVIFLSTANKMSVDPAYSVAFEDSLNGAISAKAARLKVVMLLDEGQFNDTTYDFTDLKLESFHNFGTAEFEYINSLF